MVAKGGLKGGLPPPPRESCHSLPTKPGLGVRHRSKDLNRDLRVIVQVLIHSREPDMDRAWSDNGRLHRIGKRLRLPAVGQGLYIEKYGVRGGYGAEIGQPIGSDYAGRLDRCKVVRKHLKILGCDRAVQDDSYEGRFYGDGIGHRLPFQCVRSIAYGRCERQGYNYRQMTIDGNIRLKSERALLDKVAVVVICLRRM